MHQSIDSLPIPKCFSHLVKNADGEPPRNLKVGVDFVRDNCSASSSFNDCDYSEDSDFGENSRNERSVTLLDKLNMQEIPDGSSIYQMPHDISRSAHHCHQTLHLHSNLDQVIQDASQRDESGFPGKKMPTESMNHHQPLPVFELSTKNLKYSKTGKSPFQKLNSSLLKLQREMKDLRHLDVSLFCQLVSLHEAIQDFKLTVSDRYSETGSEYSLGTASYMGSMSSLNDDSDWAEDGTILNSPHGHDLHETVEGRNFGDADGTPTATSLLQQITDLALRADQDF